MPLIRSLIAALAAATLLVLAPAAHADGDPASDVLVSENVFYGTGLDLMSKPAAQLPAMLTTSAGKGYEIRVALIPEFADLGIATWMWKDPKAYAKYLGDELGYTYKARTLILMPNGYAIFHLGHSTVREQRLLDRLPAPRKSARFLPGAIDAVRRLAAAQGVKLSVPNVKVPPGGVQANVLDHGAPANPDTTVVPGATIAPRTGSTPPVVAAKSSGGTWMFAIPVVAFVLVAVGAIVRGRMRRRAASPSA